VTRFFAVTTHKSPSSKVHAIFESRAAIEGATARLAARRITADQRKKLAAAIEAMEPGATLKRAELNRINNEFHGLIVHIADNPFLAQFHERTLFYYWMLRIPIMFAADQLAATNAQHRRILDALVRKDEEGAERAAREHVETTMNIVEPALQGL
jgi:DNA-binding GntR family transcriptional regulator